MPKCLNCHEEKACGLWGPQHPDCGRCMNCGVKAWFRRFLKKYPEFAERKECGR